MISFDVTKEDDELIHKIIDRAADLFAKRGSQLDRLDTFMDITATRANGCPLRLADLAEADDFNLLHDVGGIANHLNRDTGRLEDMFRPRFSQKGDRNHE